MKLLDDTSVNLYVDSFFKQSPLVGALSEARTGIRTAIHRLTRKFTFDWYLGEEPAGWRTQFATIIQDMIDLVSDVTAVVKDLMQYRSLTDWVDAGLPPGDEEEIRVAISKHCAACTSAGVDPRLVFLEGDDYVGAMIFAIGRRYVANRLRECTRILLECHHSMDNADPVSGVLQPGMAVVTLNTFERLESLPCIPDSPVSRTFRQMIADPNVPEDRKEYAREALMYGRLGDEKLIVPDVVARQAGAIRDACNRKG